MSLAIPSDGRGRSGSGETQARPEATGIMTEIYALLLYLNEKSFKGRKMEQGATMKSYAVGFYLMSHYKYSLRNHSSMDGLSC